MQTTPHPERTLTPTHFSATFENQGSGTIYNTKYMFAIGKKNTIPAMQLIEYSAQSNVLAAPLKCRQLHIQREHQCQHSFQLPLKTKVLHHLQHAVHVRYREETKNVKLLHNGKPASSEIQHFSHSVCKTQCAGKQLIECSAQSNDLAAPLKCRQLHIQRQHQHQRSFQVPLKTKLLAPFTTRSTCSL